MTEAIEAKVQLFGCSTQHRDLRGSKLRTKVKVMRLLANMTFFRSRCITLSVTGLLLSFFFGKHLEFFSIASFVTTAKKIILFLNCSRVLRTQYIFNIFVTGNVVGIHLMDFALIQSPARWYPFQCQLFFSWPAKTTKTNF